jgi:hypothetical protein
MSAIDTTESNPLNRLPVDFLEYGDTCEFTFGSSDPGADGFSLYHGGGFDVLNPFEEIGEQYATDASIDKLAEMVAAYKGAELCDISHLDPRGAYYAEAFQVEFAVEYLPGENDFDAQMRLISDTDYQRFHNEAMVLYTFRDAFATFCGVDLATLYPAD